MSLLHARLGMMSLSSPASSWRWRRRKRWRTSGQTNRSPGCRFSTSNNWTPVIKVLEKGGVECGPGTAFVIPSSRPCPEWIIRRLTITLEIGDIKRLPDRGSLPVTAGRWRACHLQRKGEGGEQPPVREQVSGVAFREAANFAKRYDESCRGMTGQEAREEQACILAAENVDYDGRRVFPQQAAVKAGNMKS